VAVDRFFKNDAHVCPNIDDVGLHMTSCSYVIKVQLEPILGGSSQEGSK